jgi:hypothetical protein
MASQSQATTNAWHHAAIRQTRNLFELFIDGKHAASPVSLRGLNLVQERVLRFGSDGPGHTAMNGLLDEIVYYDRALPDSEIQKLHQVADCMIRLTDEGRR